MKPIKVIYLAGPCRATEERMLSPGVQVSLNIYNARQAAIELWEKGFYVICPHLNTANFEVHCQAPEDIYLEGYLEILSRCDALVALPNWRNSQGSRDEIAKAIVMNIPVYHYPDNLPSKSTLRC